MTISRRGAPAAYKGYRLQALYTLDRLLALSGDSNLVLQPEGKEDLDILEDGYTCEVVQVKSYPSLTLSDLELDKSGSFFRRAIDLASESNQLRILLVNFGPIGSELQGAWAGAEPQRARVVAKLKEEGFTAEKCQTLLQRIELVSLDEHVVRERVFRLLGESLVGVDSETAFDLLNNWYYHKAEWREPITRRDAIERITSVGQFLAERHAYHQEWFTSIEPLEAAPVNDIEHDQLHNEFFAGIAARYEHIVADLDFLRPRWLQAIADGFVQHNVVIVHAASGQGKSTLAYRYLHDYYPASWCFRITLIQDRQHVLRIARALAGFAKAVQAPMAIFIDVSPRDIEWPELVQHLAPNRFFHILVTIREEDLRRSIVPGATYAYADVELTFDAEGGREIFERAAAMLPTRRFLDFDEAWDAFGERGPLLEFVYLLTQTTTLHDRLQQQIARIRAEIQLVPQRADELRMLQMVAVASAYEARIDVARLAAIVSLPDLAWSLEQFEREYLVRLTHDRRAVEGLHPVRSQILVDLLTDPALTSWRIIATQMLSLLYEVDTESFLLHALIERQEDELALLTTVRTHVWQSWSGLAGVLRVQIWAAIRAYVEENRALIQEAYDALGAAWWIVLNFDVAGLSGNVTQEWVAIFGELLSEERRQLIEALQVRQTPKDTLFQTVAEWLMGISVAPARPATAGDWAGVSQVWFWLNHLQIAASDPLELTDYDLDVLSQNADIELLADLSFALFTHDAERHAVWLSRHMPMLHERLAQVYQIIALAVNERTLTTHYLLDTENAAETTEKKPSRRTPVEDGDKLHAATIERLQMVRQLFPMYEAYGAQAYGHNFGDVVPLPVDESRKEGVRADALHPVGHLSLNVIAHNLAWYRFRPNTWPEFVDRALDLRRAVVLALGQLVSALKTFALQGNRQGKTTAFTRAIDFEHWSRCQAALGDRSSLPKIAVDPWGFGGESQTDQVLYLSQHAIFISQAVVTRRYRSYFKQEQDYTVALSAFFKHAVEVMLTNIWTAHLVKGTPQYERAIAWVNEQGIHTDRAHLSTYTLAEARHVVDAYQRQFRVMFGVLVDDLELTEVEENERGILDRLWPAWYFFAHQPEQRWASPQSQILAQLQSARRIFQERLQRACAAVAREGVRAILRAGIGYWDGQPVVWLQLDLDNSLALYNELKALVQALRVALGQVDYQDLLSYIIQETGNSIAIVPTIRGRALNQSAWKLATRTTVMSEIDFDDREMRWKFIPQPIPDEIWLQLGLEVWQSADIDLVNRLFTAVAEIWLLVARLATLLSLPDMTDPGSLVAQRFADEQAGLIGERLQAFYDAFAAVTERFTALSEEFAITPGDQQEVASTLSELYQLVRPTDADTDHHSLAIASLAEYVPHLERASGLAEAIRLYWLSDVMRDAR